MFIVFLLLYLEFLSAVGDKTSNVQTHRNKVFFFTNQIYHIQVNTKNHNVNVFSIYSFYS